MTQLVRRAAPRAVGLGGVLALAITSIANADPQDYSALTSGFGAELTAALPVALGAVGLFIGVIMAYKVVRRVLRA